MPTNGQSITDWIQAISALISAIGLVVAVSQINLTRKSIRADHERARKEKAIEVVSRFSSFISDNGSAVKNLAERLNFAQATALWKEEPFELDKKYLEYLESAVPKLGPFVTENGKDTFTVQKAQSSTMRRLLSAYLNEAEIALAAARHGVADIDMVLEQFAFLIRPDQNIWALQTVRNIAGGKAAFPSLHWFEAIQREKDSKVLPGKAKTGNV